jgi:hypothetical protein
LAWGPQGHRVIAHIALDRLSPQARAGVKSLLHEGDTIVEISTWADNEGHEVVPRSATWHYVNVPISAARYQESDCKRGECVVEKIKHYRRVLADRSAPRQERQRALLFLVHLIADVHQPLHVGDHDDRGGNLTQVQFLGTGTNLHRLWDSDLIHHIGGNDRAWVSRAERLITPETQAEWSKGTIEDWTNESLRAAKVAYRKPGGFNGPMASGASLGEDYARMAEPILLERMAQAGIRLANELNAIFR